MGPWRWNPLDDILPDASSLADTISSLSDHFLARAGRVSVASLYNPVASGIFHK